MTQKLKLLLHTCCAPCVVYVHRLLEPEYDITAMFYNPNIYPLEEYNKRKDELLAYASIAKLKLVVEPADFEGWLISMSGLEALPEGAQRCWKCYEYRMEKAASYAKENNFDIFTTVLSISPHKNADKLNEIGKELAQKYDIDYFEANFKKSNGFKIASGLSKEYNMYRQTYCGCRYSMKKS